MGVSNEAMIEAKKNPDYQRIINAVLSKYRNTFSYEELKNIGDTALWDCLQKHDSSKGNKFTSSLYNHVQWQIFDELRKLRKTNKYITNVDYTEDGKVLGSKEYNGEQQIEVRDALSTLDDQCREVINLYYIKNFTLAEISTKLNISIEITRRRLKKALELLRKKCS